MIKCNIFNTYLLSYKSNETEAEYRKYIAIKYLLQCNGEEFVDRLISSDTEDSILEYLSTRLIEHNHTLIKEMIIRNKNSDDYFLFIRELIILNDSYGLKKYISFVKDNHTIPELYDKKYSNLDITMQLRKLSDDSLINEIMELFIVAYSVDFCDKEDGWGIKGNLYNMLTNMCKKSSYSNEE